MKTIITRLVLVFFAGILLSVSVVPVITFAASSSTPQGSTNPLEDSCKIAGAGKSPICMNPPSTVPNPIGGPTGIIAKILKIVVFAAGTATVVMVVVGGLEYVMSTGDSNKVNTAKNTILYALVGLVITIFAEAILKFVVRRL